VLDGRSKQRTYVIPSLDAVIVRLGESPDDAWEEAWLPRKLAEAPGAD
jgi:hypothetical protein